MITPFEPELVTTNNNKKVISYGLSSFGYDIRLSSKELYIYNTGTSDIKKKEIDPKDFSQDLVSKAKIQKDKTGSFFIIPPHGYALGVSVERFAIPKFITAIAVGKSTYARAGIIVNITPLEAGWSGYLTIEIANLTALNCRVYALEGIAQILFLSGYQCSKSYSDRQGKYQNQDCKVTLPIM